MSSSPCAPRAPASSARVWSRGDPKWIDAAGTYRAGILASRVYELLGKKGYGSDIRTGSMRRCRPWARWWEAIWPSASTRGPHLRAEYPDLL